MKVISLDSFDDNILTKLEADKILSDLYSELDSKYSTDLYKCFEDENSPAYKFVNLITNIPDNGVEEAKIYTVFLYLYNRLKISLTDLLSYLEEFGYYHENLKEWLEDNAYYLRGLKVVEFYKYINGYPYNGRSVASYIDNDLLKNTKYVKNTITRNTHKYKVYPNGIRYSINNTYFRNYREVYDEYDKLMKENGNVNFITTAKIPDIYKDEIDTLLTRTLSYGILSDRALLQKTKNSTIIFFKDSLLNSKICYILDDEYYISTVRDDASKLLDEFIIYLVNHLEEFDLASYDDINFSEDLKTYINRYVDILLNTKNILHIHKITFFLLLLKMFDSTDVSGKLEMINDIMSTFDSFKSHLLGILKSISKASIPESSTPEESKDPRFILADIQNEENKEEISKELGK